MQIRIFLIYTTVIKENYSYLDLYSECGDYMYVCLCNGVTDKQIREAVQGGCDNLSSVRRKMSVGNQCGKCTKTARKVIQQEIEQDTNLIARFR